MAYWMCAAIIGFGMLYSPDSNEDHGSIQSIAGDTGEWCLDELRPDMHGRPCTPSRG
jgi:hypothetical protein